MEASPTGCGEYMRWERDVAGLLRAHDRGHHYYYSENEAL